MVLKSILRMSKVKKIRKFMIIFYFLSMPFLGIGYLFLFSYFIHDGLIGEMGTLTLKEKEYMDTVFNVFVNYWWAFLLVAPLLLPLLVLLWEIYIIFLKILLKLSWKVLKVSLKLMSKMFMKFLLITLPILLVFGVLTIIAIFYFN